MGGAAFPAYYQSPAGSFHGRSSNYARRSIRPDTYSQASDTVEPPCGRPWESGSPILGGTLEGHSGWNCAVLKKMHGFAAARTCTHKLSTRSPGSLRCFEGPAALQATSFVARRDQPAERAHSLGGKVARMCFHLQKLPQRSAQEGAQTAQAGNKRMRGKGHVGNFAFLLRPPR